MKIKLDFVTNSSSNCYILCINSMRLYEELNQYVIELAAHEYACESCHSQFFGTSIEALNTYTQGHPWDWASKPRGLDYYYLGPTDHSKMESYIKDGKSIAMAEIDRNVSHFFYEKYKEYIIESIAW